ncbi:uncharacterized protein N7483_007801 [Penicillium malachiteum]|uniref:uncharacterized protein n=1 Tax=Penicillium malachiteum TaxID=1324776 RepID=UPI002548BDAF|nr:uncharacterized protein N7483_007801 [Penicillium malachiteum]KAJ5726444.1 hypothetical protein N7483_007801 [Penicillium malachiteum]
MGFWRSSFGLGLVAGLVIYWGPIIWHVVKIGGVLDTPKQTLFGEGEGPIYIEDTIHCEDVHHYLPANLLFTACEDTVETRMDWFPGLGHLEPHPSARGSIHVVDPQTFTSRRLEFENFEGSFVTHGIDVIEDPKHKGAVYIFAVNHLPNPEYFNVTEPVEGTLKARSQIELFHHVLQSNTVQHIRSIRHPLIRTPNDIVASSPDSFYVTNDHYYIDGFMRIVEILWPQAKWSSIIHVEVTDFKSTDATEGFKATVANQGLWNNNGLGHSRTDTEIVISSPAGGQLYLAEENTVNKTLSVHTTISFSTVCDNPSYYIDPYSTEEDDATGFVVGGISQHFTFPKTAKDPNGLDPVQIWYARPQPGTENWEQKLLFEDDGSRLRTASASVLIPIKPVDGKKKAWLFATGFMSKSMIAVQVEL